MSLSNTALYVTQDLKLETRQQEKLYSPRNGELLIETIYSGVNPADVKHATQFGVYPAVLGYDFCGKVINNPTNSRFQQGDIVAGGTPSGIDRPLKYGTHQRYLICPDDMAYHVPANLPQHHAACLTVVVMTACDALFNLFKFSLPGKSSVSGEPQPLLIWGASSSVGLSALQLARASGIHPILVTASPKNHELLKKLGASYCFDYGSPSVADEIKEVLEKEQWGSISHAFDTIGSMEGLGSAQVMAGCVPDSAKLASVIPQPDPCFQTPFPVCNAEATFKVQGLPGPIKVPARKADYENALKGLQWVVSNYGEEFELPQINVFTGSAEEALKELMVVAEHGRGLGKVVLQHPLRRGCQDCK